MSNATLTITAGATSSTLTITTIEDEIDEPNETFLVTLSNPSATATLGTSDTATGTIEDDEATPELSIADARAAEGDGWSSR